MSKKTYHINGMHCASCEILLEKEIKKIPGVESCYSSHKKGILSINSKNKIPTKAIKKAINKCNLKLEINKKARVKEKANKGQDYIEIMLIVICILSITFILNKLKIDQYFPDISENTGILMAIILGFIASLSTCLVLIGGIVLSFGSMVANNSSKTFLQRARPHIYFHIGRLAAFFLLGGLLGFMGSKMSYSIRFTGFLTFLVAIAMLYIGLQILNIVPSITRLGFHLPKSLSKHVHNLENCKHEGAPILIGALTFLIPCGFTQSMQLTAVASGSFWKGALLMSAFALGTLPALFSLGLGSSVIKNKDFKLLKKTIGVIVVLFGLYSIQSALILSGFSLKHSLIKTESAVMSTQSKEEQVVKMRVDWVYEPSEFKVKKGIPVRWEIDGINVSGCTNEVVIPKLGFSKKINQGKNIAYFTPTETGILPFSCWMGMASGRFIVTE